MGPICEQLEPRVLLDAAALLSWTFAAGAGAYGSAHARSQAGSGYRLVDRDQRSDDETTCPAWAPRRC